MEIHVYKTEPHKNLYMKPGSWEKDSVSHKHLGCFMWMDLVSYYRTAHFLQAHHRPSEGNPFTIVQAQVPPSDVYSQVLQVLDHTLKKGILTVRSKSGERD